MNTISLSKHVNVPREKLEEMGVFDATLGIDTKLFVDPKLLVNSDIPEFKNSREKILRYFRQLLKVYKASPRSPRLRNEAVKMLAVPEPEGLSIGYGDATDNGTSIAKSVANEILLSIGEILAVGLEDAEVVELLGIFVDGFGPDSISDLTIHIIYEDFCTYTARVAAELGVPTTEYKIEGVKYLLPTHPFSKKQLIFVPYALLRDLPVATSWSEVAQAAAQSDELRKQFDEIVRPALEDVFEDASSKNKDELDSFKKDLGSLLDIYRKIRVSSYDLALDEKGYYQIDPFVAQVAQYIKAQTKPQNPDELIEAVRQLITQFTRSIEDNGGNTLLYHKTRTGTVIPEKPHNEDVAQRLFYMIADLFCSQAGIMLAGESDSGRGPVDFSLGTGYDEKVLVEVKKSTNNKLVDGFKEQIKAYQKGEKAAHSFYVVIVVKESPKKRGLTSQLDAVWGLHEENKKAGILSPELVVIDGLIHPSPSKLKAEASK
jgi:hypothetical protein